MLSDNSSEFGIIISNESTNTTHQSKVYEISKSFMFFTLAIILPVGLLCNTLSAVVFMTKPLRNRASSWYLAALAVSDDLALLTVMVDYWLKDERVGLNTVQTSRALCISITYLSYTARLLSAWLITAFTIERFIGVVYPLKRAALSSTSHARKVIACQTGPCFVLTSFTLFTIDIVEVPYGTDCDVRPDLFNVYLVFNVLFVIFGSIVVPILIICTLNIFILHKVYQRRKNFAPRNLCFNRSSILSYKSAKDYNIATVLLVVSMVFVALNVPYCACWFILFFYHFDLVGHFGPNVIWKLYAAKYISSVPYYLNYSINFGLYNLCARKFRKQLQNTFWCKNQDAASNRLQEERVNMKLKSIRILACGDEFRLQENNKFPQQVLSRSRSATVSRSSRSSSHVNRNVMNMR